MPHDPEWSGSAFAALHAKVSERGACKHLEQGLERRARAGGTAELAVAQLRRPRKLPGLSLSLSLPSFLFGFPVPGFPLPDL